MTNKYVKDIVAKIPFEPGIYMMKDEKGEIIYVGKAISLRKRVRQYFQKNNKTKRIENMASLVRDIDYIVVNNEVEALNLECNYIKKLSPKFNVLLKDDKTYPYIKVTIKDKYPLIYVTRRRIDDKALYFGPYTNVGAMRDALHTIKEIFPVKRCKYNLDKTKIKNACLYYHIGRCLGPCINEVSLKAYKEMIDQVVLFLEGKTTDVKKMIETQIEECIQKLEFEKAANLKQRIDNIDKFSQKQNVSNLNEISTDIWGYVFFEETLYVQIFKIRDYKIALHDNVKLTDVSQEEVEESLVQIVSNYYTDNNGMPKKVYITLSDGQVELINKLFEKRENHLQVICPKRGEKAKLVKMVENNIHINIEDNKNNVIEDLASLLGFKEGIDSIECYDISNLRNEYIVGCMIRFENGKLNKSMYRKFKIRSTLTQDDPQCMYEVISRRLKHSKEWPLPDVMFIDGAMNQLNAVKRAMKESQETTNIYGMVKNDKHRTRGLIDENGNEIDLLGKKQILNFITFLQDEIHRFVITYHRQLRDSIKLKDGKIYKNIEKKK